MSIAIQADVAENQAEISLLVRTRAVFLESLPYSHIARAQIFRIRRILIGPPVIWGSSMNYLVGGKLLETIGALFIAYVAVRACALEMKSGYHLKRQSADLETQLGKEDDAVDETEKLRKGLRQVLERRHRQFGFYEALLVGSGTMLVALGCVLYLVGVLIESH